MFAALLTLIIAVAAPPAESLNALLDEIAKLRAKGAVAESLPIPPATVAKLNVASVKFPNAETALLREPNKVTWPKALLALQPAEDVADARRRVEKALALSARQLPTGPADGKVINLLRDATADLDKWLTRRALDIAPMDYAAAKAFVKLLTGTSNFLALPDAKEFLPMGKFMPSAANAADLCDFMIERKLRFRQPLPADSPAYDQVRSSLEKYRNALRVASPG